MCTRKSGVQLLERSSRERLDIELKIVGRTLSTISIYFTMPVKCFEGRRPRMGAAVPRRRCATEARDQLQTQEKSPASEEAG